MPDYTLLMADWEALLARRGALREPLGFWTAILEGWASWKPPAPLVPLSLGADECRARWARGESLMARSVPTIPADSVEDLLGPLMERLAADGPDAAEALRRFAADWDEGRVDVTALLPAPGRDPVARLEERFGLGAHLGAFLAPAALRPALETYFESVRELPDGAWGRGGCPWCGGAAAYGDVVEDGRRRLSCHLCGGGWIGARLRCPFCESQSARDLVRLTGAAVEQGYVIEACRACRGYLKGVDRRQRGNAGPPLVEDWGSPHLDLYAAREGYRRSTPSLAHLLPREDGAPR
ncbi:MAG TPA: formate dehydrogenase accessory protein FdhE [Methylomirabilota bacterium]